MSRSGVRLPSRAPNRNIAVLKAQPHQIPPQWRLLICSSSLGSSAVKRFLALTGSRLDARCCKRGPAKDRWSGGRLANTVASASVWMGP